MLIKLKVVPQTYTTALGLAISYAVIVMDKHFVFYSKNELISFLRGVGEYETI